MRRSLVLYAVLLLTIATICQQQAFAVTLRNPGFDEGKAGWSGHWWSPWDWYTFTICPPDQSDPPLPAEYIWRDWAVGAVNLPTVNGFPQWDYISAWDPTIGATSGGMSYGMTPYSDFSDGYDRPAYVGQQWMKKNPGNPYYSGVGQYAGCLEPGKVYEVSAWAVSSCEYSPADMRILIDPNGGNDARVASISSAAVPNHPLGRYWIWSKTGNNRIGNYVDVQGSDTAGAYSIYDRVSAQFTATSSQATIFLLMDSTPWVRGDGPGRDLGIGWDQVEIREVHAPVSTIAEAKTVPDGTSVTLTGVVVTGVFPDGIYGTDLDAREKHPCLFVQDQDRSAGILILSGRTVSKRDIVTIEGTVKTYGGQPGVKATNVTVTGSTPSDPLPVGMTNAASGGSNVQGGVGLDSLGLLVKVWGKVTEFDWYGIDPSGLTFAYAYLDDGSNVPGGAARQIVSNPDFETFSGSGQPTVPTGWSRIKGADAATEDPGVHALGGCNDGMGPHSGRVFVGRTGGTGHAWCYQSVSGLSAGQQSTAKAYGWSGVDANARVRLGVNPAGGSDPLAAGIVWGPSVYTEGQWQLLSVDFVSATGSATVFLECDHAGTVGSPRTGFDDVNVYSPSVAKTGIRLVCPWDMSISAGQNCAITGNLWTEKARGEMVPTRLLLPRDSSDKVAY